MDSNGKDTHTHSNTHRTQYTEWPWQIVLPVNGQKRKSKETDRKKEKKEEKGREREREMTKKKCRLPQVTTEGVYSGTRQGNSQGYYPRKGMKWKKFQEDAIAAIATHSLSLSLAFANTHFSHWNNHPRCRRRRRSTINWVKSNKCSK